MISNCGHDENGKYSGGKSGDQNGTEWQVIPWYNRPWNVVLRHPDKRVQDDLAYLGRAAAENNDNGYDQGQRTTYWEQLEASGYDPAKITVKCEADCSAGVAANVKACGYRLGIPSLQAVSKDCYTGNLRAALKKAGFQEFTESKYLTGPDYLLPGDILLYEGHHVATNLDAGSKAIVAGWHQDEHGWWYQDPDGGYPRMEWRLINHHWYLFGNSGYMITGWAQWDGKKTGSGDWYYLEEEGDYQGACWHAKGNSGALERWYVE